MPHCIIEYAYELEYKMNVNELAKSVHNGAKHSGLFNDNDIKTRSIAYKHHQIGEGVSDFIHVTLKVLSGRSAEQKKNLSSLVLNSLQKLGLIEICITVEVVDMDSGSYQKLVY